MDAAIGKLRWKLLLAAAWGAVGLAGVTIGLVGRGGPERLAMLAFLAAWGTAAWLFYRHARSSTRVLAEVKAIPVEAVFESPFRVRVVPDPESVEGLARSIETYGMIVPVLVRPRGEKYELVTGQRRLLAAKRLGRTWVPALVRTLSDKDMLEVGLLDNVQHQPLSQVEEARTFSRLSREFEAVPAEALAARLGLDPAWTESRRRLLALPEVVQQAVILGEITSAHAQSLVGLADEAAQVAFLRRICEEKLGPRETARQIGEYLQERRRATPEREGPSAPPAGTEL